MHLSAEPLLMLMAGASEPDWTIVSVTLLIDKPAAAAAYKA